MNEEIFNFECTQCGKCCGDPNTIVNLTYADIMRIAYEKNYSVEEFLNVVGFYQFDEELDGGDSNDKMVIPPINTESGPAFVGLLKNNNGACIFLKSNKCSIYSARPNICRTFPFHFYNIDKFEIGMDYTEKAKEYCPGIHKKYSVDVQFWKELGANTIRNINLEKEFVRKWNESTNAGKFPAKASNYLRIILAQFESEKARMEANESNKPDDFLKKSLSRKEMLKQKLQKNQGNE